MISGLSVSKISHNSILSNQEIWNNNFKQEDTNAFLQEIEKISNDLKNKNKKQTQSITSTPQEEDYDDEILNENVSSVQPKQSNYLNNNLQLSNVPLFSNECYLKGNFYPHNQQMLNYAIHLQQNALMFNQHAMMQIQQQNAFCVNNYPINNKVYNGYSYDNNINKQVYTNNNKNKNEIQIMSNNKRVNINVKDKKNKNIIFSNKKESNHQNTNNNTNNSNNNTSNTNTSSNLSKKINIDDIITGKEKRTTLMLRNIPNKYTLNNLVEEINPSFWGKFDYINLPIDYDRKLNLGYAFINFVDPMHIILFYETYRLKKWTKYRSDKKMDMTYADKQGKKDINCKDEQTYFAENDKRFNFTTLQLKIEIPVSYLDFFKKIYTNSVCVVQQDKHPIYNDKCFIVKSFGKKI